MQHVLFLVPNFIGLETKDLLAERTLRAVYGLSTFIVEREKSARAFLKNIEHPLEQAKFNIHELDKHRDYENFRSFFDAEIKQHSIGLLSEAGMPGIADPGADIVAYAHKCGIPVVPLSGSSSIFLALAASGMNGQQFSFHGYLPIQKGERVSALKKLEKVSVGHAQIFIEAPYRNMALVEEMKRTLAADTAVCIACDLESDNELILRAKASDLQIQSLDLHKKPCIFIIQRD